MTMMKIMAMKLTAGESQCTNMRVNWIAGEDHALAHDSHRAPMNLILVSP